jgi:excisionase family DNA binding protein
MSKSHGSTTVVCRTPCADPAGRQLDDERMRVGAASDESTPAVPSLRDTPRSPPPPQVPRKVAPPANADGTSARAADGAALLDLTLRDLLARLVGPGGTTEPDHWIDPRNAASPVPYRTVLSAARRGDLALCKVGRRLLVRRSELDRWIAAQPIGAQPAPATVAPHGITHILQAHGYARKTPGHA